MNIKHTTIEGLIVFTPKKYEDNRGYFVETYNQQKFNELVGKEITFVQDNESVSKKNVLRGLHFQSPPFAQGKLVRVTEGAVLDIAVDLRKNSATYGQWHSEILSAENGTQFWIPDGFAHGFVALEENTKFNYKCTNYYHPQSEQTILWNDSSLAIDWNIEHPLISEKDAIGMVFNQFETPFID